MPKLIVVAGATATGKSHFIERQFSDGTYEILDALDYQRRIFKENSYKGAVPLRLHRRLLLMADQQLLGDVIAKLCQGKNVVVEHTLLKAKRRLTYMDIQKEQGLDQVTAEVYVLTPTQTEWARRIEQRGLSARAQSIMSQAQDLEFPNEVEGWDRIFQVTDNEVRLRMDPPTPEILEPAREELRQETEALRKEDEEVTRRRALLESMNTRPFFHYCEVCLKTAWLTAEAAFEDGWDYPPKGGRFGLLGPRICGNCRMVDTLYWKVSQQPLPIVVEGELTPAQLVTWRRIKGEPESLLEPEEG